MKNTKILVKTENKKYFIIVGANVQKKTGVLIKKILPNVKKIAVITDKKLPSYILKKTKLSLKNFSLSIFKLPSGEKTKNIYTAEKLINLILKKKFSRSDCIIALGGGVIGDLSGLVASLVKRGIKFVNIPTSLLAQVDASVGGKTAINSDQGKNLIGSFYQPELIISDTNMINSLPHREMVCGYAEILKHSLILDRKFYFWLLKNGKILLYKKNKNFLGKSIIKSCKIKSQIVEKDEKEKNLRMILNFGHTFGHALEAVKKFSKKLNHGEAVLLGMILASQFSYEKKFLPIQDLIQIKKHYLDLNLPIDIKKSFKKKDINKIIYFMKSDKKNINSKINLILLKKIGVAMKPRSFAVSEIKKFLQSKLN